MSIEIMEVSPYCTFLSSYTEDINDEIFNVTMKEPFICEVVEGNFQEVLNVEVLLNKRIVRQFVFKGNHGKYLARINVVRNKNCYPLNINIDDLITKIERAIRIYKMESSLLGGKR